MERLRPDWAAVRPVLKIVARNLAVFFLVAAVVLFFVARGRIDQHTRQLNETLVNFYEEGISIQINFDDKIPLNIAVPLGELVDLSELIPGEIPFSLTVPIETSFNFKQDLSIPVNIPLLGMTIIDVPIDIDIPINQEISINSDLAIDVSAFQDPGAVIEINQDIEVKVPLQLNLSAHDLGLEESLQSLIGLVNTLRLLFLLKGL